MTPGPGGLRKLAIVTIAGAGQTAVPVAPVLVTAVQFRPAAAGSAKYRARCIGRACIGNRHGVAGSATRHQSSSCIGFGDADVGAALHPNLVSGVGGVVTVVVAPAHCPASGVSRIGR